MSPVCSDGHYGSTTTVKGYRKHFPGIQRAFSGCVDTRVDPEAAVRDLQRLHDWVEEQRKRLLEVVGTSLAVQPDDRDGVLPPPEQTLLSNR